MEVLFHNLPFSPIAIINSSFDLINFEENIKNFLISLWIQPLFTIIPLNSLLNHQIGKFGNIFDMRACEIDDLAGPSRQSALIVIEHLVHHKPYNRRSTLANEDSVLPTRTTSPIFQTREFPSLLGDPKPESQTVVNDRYRSSASYESGRGG